MLLAHETIIRCNGESITMTFNDRMLSVLIDRNKMHHKTVALTERR